MMPITITPPPNLSPALFDRLYADAARTAEGREPAHDFLHVLRVVANVRAIARAEGADEAVVVTAALLHELFTLPKNHPDSPRAGDLCAEHVAHLLAREGAEASFAARVVACVRDHAFSKGVVPDDLEAKVLQDGDRLDALGAIGLARMWATCADMKRPFYDPADPFCRAHAPDDKQWGLDHVYKKLLLLEDRFHTAAARKLAAPRVAYLRSFLSALEAELGQT